VDFDSLFEFYESEKGYINGIDSKVWIKKVDRLIGEFFFVCPPEYSAMKFTVISMDAFNLKIRCDRGDSKVNRKDITSTLSNFFKSEDTSSGVSAPIQDNVSPSYIIHEVDKSGIGHPQSFVLQSCFDIF
jgi:hypothetical protein